MVSFLKYCLLVLGYSILNFVSMSIVVQGGSVLLNQQILRRPSSKTSQGEWKLIVKGDLISKSHKIKDDTLVKTIFYMYYSSFLQQKEPLSSQWEEFYLLFL